MQLVSRWRLSERDLGGYLHGTSQKLNEVSAGDRRFGGSESTQINAEKMLLDIRRGDRACHLNKSLYGLCQTGRRWYTKLKETMQKLDAWISFGSLSVLYRFKGRYHTDNDVCWRYLDSLTSQEEDIWTFQGICREFRSQKYKECQVLFGHQILSEVWASDWILKTDNTETLNYIVIWFYKHFTKKFHSLTNTWSKFCTLKIISLFTKSITFYYLFTI